MMDKTKIYDVLRDIFAEVFMRDDIPLSASLSAKDVAGWDSIKQVEIIMETEQRFGVRFASQEVDNFRNVGDLVTTVMRASDDPAGLWIAPRLFFDLSSAQPPVNRRRPVHAEFPAACAEQSRKEHRRRQCGPPGLGLAISATGHDR